MDGFILPNSTGTLSRQINRILSPVFSFLRGNLTSVSLRNCGSELADQPCACVFAFEHTHMSSISEDFCPNTCIELSLLFKGLRWDTLVVCTPKQEYGTAVLPQNLCVIGPVTHGLRVAHYSLFSCGNAQRPDLRNRRVIRIIKKWLNKI